MVSFVFVFSIRGKQSIFNKFDCKAFKLETKKNESPNTEKIFPAGLKYEKQSLKPKKMKQ